jgi:hypothetical protein
MGILALPLAFALFLFLIPGIGLAVAATRANQNRPSCIRLLVFVVLVELSIGFIGPFVILHGTKINAWSLFFGIFFRDIIGALIIGCASIFAYYFSRRKSIYLVIAASTFIAAGLVPVAWFTISQSLVTFFNIKLSY